MAIIDEFIARYDREYFLYDTAARSVAERLRRDLQEVGVRCIVTHRAKASDRLREKCVQRNESKNYKTVDEIIADIADLAGVRVAVYFPAERDRVDRVLTRKFSILEPRRTFPQDEGKRSVGQDSYRARFPGYSATHYRVSLAPGDLTKEESRCVGVRVEVQVASVLMHAWSEVEHDLAYKPLQGELSVEEYSLLDQLNGLVHAGEMALERMQFAGQRRTDVAGQRFDTHYDLAAHLLGHVRDGGRRTALAPEVGAVEILHRFLIRLDLNSPSRIAPYLSGLSTGLVKQTLADQVLESLVDEDVSRIRILRSAQAGSGSNSEPEAIGDLFFRFIVGWNDLENRLRNLAPDLDGSSVLQVLARSLIDRGVIGELLYSKIMELRERRNRYVHLSVLPVESDLRFDLQKLEDVIEALPDDQDC
ncbi:GTP pyrophosphokinase family protein [Nocardia salmonicida]|uniref:GTP pyrophosphokinase family protein n=1 Tax=Nocardia salmonicida TaxID=53431 RepID=UPI0037A13F25